MEMGELSKIEKNPVKARPVGFMDARLIEVGVLPGLKFNTTRIEAKAGEKSFLFSQRRLERHGSQPGIITPGSSQTVLTLRLPWVRKALRKILFRKFPNCLPQHLRSRKV
ncbi:MAG: hypothetical protein CM15mP130_0880 [Verrucomicrobiota bacterium]|nr:MAG: hypothetical protein CM15mP130_0880 [Verrucomicrobiota bacterium]